MTEPSSAAPSPRRRRRLVVVGGTDSRRHRHHHRDRRVAHEHLRAKAGSAESLLPRRRAERHDDRSGGVGEEFPHSVRHVPSHRRSSAHAVRRKRGDAAHADRCRPANGGGAVAAGGGSEASGVLGGICVRARFPRGARARIHARRPDVHRATDRREAARDVPQLSRIDVRGVSRGRATAIWFAGSSG